MYVSAWYFLFSKKNVWFQVFEFNTYNFCFKFIHNYLVFTTMNIDDIFLLSSYNLKARIPKFIVIVV